MNISTVLFDLDGTLIDTAPDFELVINLLLSEYKKPPLPYTKVRASVSNGARALITLAFSITPEHTDFPVLLARLLEIYHQHLDIKSQPFAGMLELLDKIEGTDMKWGIVTNKHSKFTYPLLKSLKLSERSSAIICPDHVTKSKPDPEPLLKAASIIGVDPSHCIYIGDHLRDIEAAKKAGMTSVAALYGYIEDSVNPYDWQAHHYVASVKEIEQYLFP